MRRSDKVRNRNKALQYLYECVEACHAKIPELELARKEGTSPNGWGVAFSHGLRWSDRKRRCRNQVKAYCCAVVVYNPILGWSVRASPLEVR